MKKKKVSRSLAERKAVAGERKEGKLKGKANVRHESSEDKRYEKMEAKGEKQEHAK